MDSGRIKGRSPDCAGASRREETRGGLFGAFPIGAALDHGDSHSSRVPAEVDRDSPLIEQPRRYTLLVGSSRSISGFSCKTALNSEL